jgi:hypothetical protein
VTVFLRRLGYPVRHIRSGFLGGLFNDTVCVSDHTASNYHWMTRKGFS